MTSERIHDRLRLEYATPFSNKEKSAQEELASKPDLNTAEN